MGVLHLYKRAGFSETQFGKRWLIAMVGKLLLADIFCVALLDK